VDFQPVLKKVWATFKEMFNQTLSIKVLLVEDLIGLKLQALIMTTWMFRMANLSPII
jgi:hypothetical protein